MGRARKETFEVGVSVKGCGNTGSGIHFFPVPRPAGGRAVGEGADHCTRMSLGVILTFVVIVIFTELGYNFSLSSDR